MPKKSSSSKKESIDFLDPSSKSIKDVFLLYKKKKNPKIREYLIVKYLKFVVSLAKRFTKGGETLRDLIQVGNLGLIHAIDRYDPERGVEFITYATPTILGEIKRYFRDKTWSIKVPRYLQDLNKSTSKAIDFLTQKLGRSPTIPEIAEYLDTPEEEILESLELGQVYNPISLDSELTIDYEEYPSVLSNVAGDIDKNLEMIGEKTDLRDALKYLTKEERLVIEGRFYKNMTQIEIAQKLKISQMQISRLQNHALAKLRRILQTKSRI